MGRSIHKYNHTIGILQSSTEARSELPIPDTHASCLPAVSGSTGPRAWAVPLPSKSGPNLLAWMMPSRILPMHRKLQTT